MRASVIRIASALPLFSAFLCIASCASSGREAEPAPPPEEAAAEAPYIPPHELIQAEPEIAEAGGLEAAEEEAPAPEEPPAPEEGPPVPEGEPEPDPLEEGGEGELPDPEDENEVVAVVDSVAITRQEFRQTRSEVEVVVEDLNKITRARDYSRWLSYLDPSYRETLSDRGYLAQISASLPQALRDRRVRLNTLRDYFDYVFVPSRQNVRVDDIQYITPSRVYVIMNLAGNRRAAVYILERGGDGSWRLADKD